ncbi:hypothetical protein J2J97_32030 (plasmid) [Rhizobium bangladeshense]|uniref:hypothetical protein n=1 Tax=Rhizobium bangladeshense TaxID=1138189 RepID=UPI001A99125D|nr:hypothetical protein [Rhizobium bangladeshense]QSY98536.1 hypothetical protein J2J97_32030 [Rhizobium bangladeshense]
MGKKEEFIDAVRPKIVAKYDWAKDAGRLERFLTAIRVTIETDSNQVDVGGASLVEAYREIGGKGKLTYKALRALCREA